MTFKAVGPTGPDICEVKSTTARRSGGSGSRRRAMWIARVSGRRSRREPLLALPQAILRVRGLYDNVSGDCRVRSRMEYQFNQEVILHLEQQVAARIERVSFSMATANSQVITNGRTGRAEFDSECQQLLRVVESSLLQIIANRRSLAE